MIASKTGRFAEAKDWYTKRVLADEKNPDPKVPPHWLAYVGVDDIEVSTRRAQELGGKMHLGVTKVGDYGWMSVIQDPTGAYFAMWKPAPAKK